MGLIIKNIPNAYRIQQTLAHQILKDLILQEHGDNVIVEGIEVDPNDSTYYIIRYTTQ